MKKRTKTIRWANVSLLAFLLVLTVGLPTQAQAGDGLVRGVNLSEIGNFRYDANSNGEESTKSHAQKAVDKLKLLGVNHIVLNPRAVMYSPYSAEIVPRSALHERGSERRRYQRLIKYIHQQGMSVGIRPIFFVVKADGSMPYTETGSDGSVKIWWHGNIQPSDPNRWFESFKAYLNIYLLIAKLNRVEEFTIGAELYSMTVGIEDQWKKHPHGFPGRWVELLKHAKRKLRANVRVMYDINFTDAKDTSGGMVSTGGELERWRYRIADLKSEDVIEFWNGLDAVGIDMYRSLAGRNDELPEDFEELVKLLMKRTSTYASQLDTALAEIQAETNKLMDIILKEIGYRSVERGFIDPFNYDRSGGAPRNLLHQAAAYETIFRAFWAPKWEWFKGIAFWDVSVDPSRTGALDRGFSPLGKPETEKVLKKYYQ